MGYKSIIEGAPIIIHYLQCLHPLCAATTYGVKVQRQPKLNLHPVSRCLTTKVQDVQVVQVCPSLRLHITYSVRNFLPGGIDG